MRAALTLLSLASGTQRLHEIYFSSFRHTQPRPQTRVLYHEVDIVEYQWEVFGASAQEQPLQLG